MKGPLTLARLMLVLTAVNSSASMARGQDAPPGAFRPDPAPKRPAARNRDAQTLLSEQDCREYGQMVVKAVKSGDRAALNALIDWESIWKTATAGFELSGAAGTELFNELSKHCARRLERRGPTDQKLPGGGRFRYSSDSAEP